MLGSVKDRGVLAYRVVYVLNAIAEFLPQPQILFDAGFGEKVESVDCLMVASDAVDSSESLDDPHRVPVEIVVDDFVPILQVQAFRQNIGSDERGQLRFARAEIGIPDSLSAANRPTARSLLRSPPYKSHQYRRAEHSD